MGRLLPVVVAAVLVAAAVSATLMLAPQAPPDEPGDGIPDGQYVLNAGDFVSAADWDTMVTVTVEMNEFAFTPEDLSFTVGTPYKLEIKNIGTEKHYFTADEFYRSMALRKAQTSEGEFKAPYLKAVEVFANDQVDVYFIPLYAGVYDSICTITGHEEQGMTGHITVTGATPASPAPVLAAVASGPWVQNAGDLVSAADWDTMTDVVVDMDEFSFSPDAVNLQPDQPYRIRINNIGAEKHYFTAEEFYETAAFRKAQDGSGEIKAPYFKAVEIFPGKTVDLYLIPTQLGVFNLVCTIVGHEDAGMHGSVVVGGLPAGQYVSNAGDFVSAADWDTMVTVTVEMNEYTFSPHDLSFTTGTPYKLEIKNIGAAKHYFTAVEFYQSMALRKAQTSEGEYKAPYLSAVEVFPGDQVDIYFIPVYSGVYDSICTITGHEEQGMTGHITVTGATPASPAPVLAAVASGPWVQNAGDLVSAADWDTMTDVVIDMDEFSFSPDVVNLQPDLPYRLRINNNGAEKHYFTAQEFYETAAFRKAQDSSGEIKAPYFKAIEVFPGQTVDLYLIPTQRGVFNLVCTIVGHEDAGMHGSVVVGGLPAGQYVSNAGDFVSAADWDTMVTVTIEMSEYAYTPEDLSFTVGTPYKLEIKNIGTAKHYFTAEEFYRSVALRKAQTSEGEFKAPYLKAVEVFAGDQVDVYFIPLYIGVYDSICTITGHADQGMTGHITVTGERPATPVPVLADVASGPWVQNAGDLVAAADWDTMITVRIEMSEFAFTPQNFTLIAGQAYKLEIFNNGTEKHYFTATDFYLSAAFRKAQDGSGEIKAPYFSAIEVFAGTQVDLYLSPTTAGTYY